MNDWSNLKLGEVIEIKYGKDHKQLSDGNIPCFGSGGLMRLVDKPLYKNESILIPRKGSLNNIMYQNNPFWTVDTMFWSKIDDRIANGKFLFYQLTLIDYTNLNVGSAVPSLTVPVLNDIDISIPPLPEQQAIAEVLSSLDDKIDLLHHQNQTLEQMAETLFRQWFIEEAKEEWEMLKVKDIAIHKKDSVNPSKNPFVEYKHFSLPAIDSGKRPQIELGSNIHSNKYLVHENSILVSKLNPRIPRIWLNLNNVDDKCICSTEFQVIKPKETEYLGFLFCLLKSDDAVSELEMSASGTSGSHQRVRPEDILNLCFNTPSIDRIIEFSKLVEPLLAKTLTNQTSINILEQKRDTLLPKLMSGEVRVKMDKE